MTTTEYKNGVIATACWRVAPNELHQVMLAVCQVFINRASAVDGDLYGEATAWLNDSPGEYPDPRDPQFQQLLSRLESVTCGMVSDKTGGALYFLPTSELPSDMLKASQI